MGLTVRKTVNFDPVPQGLHHAVCYGLYDLGTQFQEKFGTYIRKVLIAWEIPGERILIEKDGVKMDLPRAMSRQYTQSLHEKSNLRKDLESWRSKAFTEEELEGFDLKTVLGANCLLQVIHKTKDGRTFANVANIVSLPKNMVKVQPENPLRYFSFTDMDIIPEGTPDWISDIIKASGEWQTFRDGGPPDAPPVDDGLGDVDSDSIPF
jgi:hypothetical protein